AEHVLRHPDRVITINDQQFAIQLKRFEDMEMVTMTHCSCTFCESCFKKYFSSVIKEKNIVHVVCPLCNLPDVQRGRREESMEYFSLLDTQIRYYLDPQIHELFQRKLRDQALQEMPNFRWCAHEEAVLHFRMHFSASYEFLRRLHQPFKQGSACNFSNECGAKGLHAHHPRNCLYHLRDWSVPRLRSLLQHYGVSHPLMFSPKNTAGRHSKGICGVMEFQESGAVKEEPCGRPALPECSGYCMVHYKECLVELINNNALDPVVLLDGVELRAEMDRWKVPVPDKQPLEPDQRYEDRLRQVSP
ncbi:hypothetical protein cypCar_00025360, partial [Cyprinus carpio]